MDLPIDSPKYASLSALAYLAYFDERMLMISDWNFSGNHQVMRTSQGLVVGVIMPWKAKLSYTGVLTHLWGGS